MDQDTRVRDAAVPTYAAVHIVAPNLLEIQFCIMHFAFCISQSSSISAIHIR